MISYIRSNKITFLLLLFCIGFGIYYIYGAIQWIPYPNQIDYGEGYIQYINNLFATGGWDWDLTTPPYIPLMYGIVTPLVDMPLINMFGNELWTTRLIMCVSAIIISVMLYLIVYRLTHKKVWGLIGALIPFTQPIIRDWSLMARVDMLAVMFDIVGLYLVIRFMNSKHIYWSIIPFTLAIFTKPTFIAALVAVLIYLLINNRRVLWRYLVILIPVVAICIAILQVMTDGHYLEHVVVASRTVDLTWPWAVIQINLVGVLTPLAIILALAVLYIKKSFSRWALRLKDIDLLGLFLVTSVVIGFISALRPGGFINYYIEFIYASCLCAVLILPRFIERTIEKYREHTAVGSYALILAAMFILMLAVSPKSAFPFPNEQYDEDVAIVTEIISDTNEPVITENTGLVMNAGKELYAEFFVITNWAQLGIWDDTNYINDYRNQKFDYIILRVPLSERPDGDGHFNKEVMQAIRDNYTLIYSPPDNFYWYGLCVYESNSKYMMDDRFNNE